MSLVDMTIPNSLMQKGIFDWSGFHTEILKEPIAREKNFNIPLDWPGLRFELDEKVAEKNPFIPWPYLEWRAERLGYYTHLVDLSTLI